MSGQNYGLMKSWMIISNETATKQRAYKCLSRSFSFYFFFYFLLCASLVCVRDTWWALIEAHAECSWDWNSFLYAHETEIVYSTWAAGALVICHNIENASCDATTAVRDDGCWLFWWSPTSDFECRFNRMIRIFSCFSCPFRANNVVSRKREI